MSKDWNEVITEDNLVSISEKIASNAIRKVLSYAYNQRISKLYKCLMGDIYKKNNPKHVLSDAYDIVQEIACFLCQHIGKELADIYGKNRRGREIDIGTACFGIANHIILLQKKEDFILVNEEVLGKMQLVTTFESLQEDREEQYDKVDETISKLNLTQGEQDVLTCYLNGFGITKIASLLSIAISTVWDRRKKLQSKYIAAMGQLK